MDKLTPIEKFPNLKKHDEFFKKQENSLLKIAKELIKNKTYITDLFIVGCINRALDLLDGFRILVNHWNLNAAAPIIRQQIDSLLRLNYLVISDNREEQRLLSVTKGICSVIVDKHNALPIDIINWLEKAIEDKEDHTLLSSSEHEDKHYIIYQFPYGESTLTATTKVLYCNYA